MEFQKASIEIEREDHKLVRVRAIMPIWQKPVDNGLFKVLIPLLGLEALAQNEKEVSEVANDLFRAFCKLSESHGFGIEAELISLSWKQCDDENEAFGLESSEFIDNLLATGETNLMEADLDLV